MLLKYLPEASFNYWVFATCAQGSAPAWKGLEQQRLLTGRRSSPVLSNAEEDKKQKPLFYLSLKSGSIIGILWHKVCLPNHRPE